MLGPHFHIPFITEFSGAETTGSSTTTRFILTHKTIYLRTSKPR